MKIQASLPERFQNMTHTEIENEIEMVKAKASCVQSNIDDLNVEVNRFVFF